MKYRLTVLTPTLAGDGNKLSPIDYMVWKDQVNVLDQRRIFRLLAKGPRLEGYLAQLRKAEKLDWASWGGFAQNFAGRRIPFDHPSFSAFWDRAPRESLFIPTFHSGPEGPFLPGTAVKGALRTALLFSRWSDAALRDAASRIDKDRPLRRPGAALEEQILGTARNARTRVLVAGDSSPVGASSMRIYLVRSAVLQRTGDRFEVGWKQSHATLPARRVDESTPQFAEMAAPGTVFEGVWHERPFFEHAEVLRALHWREPAVRARLFEACNQFASHLLAVHREFAEKTSLEPLAASLKDLEGKLAEVRENGSGCLLQIGWGGGILSKISAPDTVSEPYRQIVRQSPFYAKAIQSGLPFPKSRRIVFAGARPSAVTGWTLLEVAGSSDSVTSGG